MIAWVGVVMVLITGLAVWARLVTPQVPAPTLAVVPMLGIAATAAWMGLLDLINIAWSPLALVSLPAAALATWLLGTRRMPRLNRPDAWLLTAVGAAAAHMTLLAAMPSFGWDFRYNWGLKAQVFAAAGRHDGAWLASAAHAFVHPSYPPLWSDLLAHGILLGGTEAAVAAAWQAVLAGGLATACWALAKPGPRWARALAAGCGAWPMVLFWPRYSGFAEPLLAYLVAIGLLAVERADGKAQVWIVAPAAACLALSKQEGIALGLGILLAAWRVMPRRRAVLAAAVWAAAVAAWQVFLASHGIHSDEYNLGFSRILTHAVALGPSLVAASKPKYLVLLAVWALAGLGLRRAATLGLRRVLAVWAAAVVGAYLTTNADLTWHLFTSLDRVLAVPLPATLAVLIGAQFNRQGPDHGEQYRSGIWYVNDKQKREAEAYIKELRAADRYDGRKIVTQVEAAKTFWPAEDYHQDYIAKTGAACHVKNPW